MIAKRVPVGLLCVGLAAFFIAAAPAISQVTADEGFNDGFEDGFTNGFEDGFSDGFGEGFDEGFGPTDSALQWSGMLRFDTRLTIDRTDPEESPLRSHPDLGLNLTHESPNSELAVRLRIRPDRLDPPDSPTAVQDFARDLVDEAHLTLFYDRFRLQAGYMRQIWGTGDQVHVVDALNSDDLRDFINPAYRERRLARPMFRLVVPVRTHGRLEAAYVPTFSPDLIPREGPWAPAEVKELTSLVEGAVEAFFMKAAHDYGSDPAAYFAAIADATDWAETALREPDTNTLEWGQFGLRYRDTLGPVDLGFIFYHGFLKQPSLTFDLAETSPALDPATGLPQRNAMDVFSVGDRIVLNYDRVNLFGLEFAAVIMGLNTRAEAAYYLTEDIDGDDPTVTNNSIRYLAGFDRDLPLSNLNLNIQGVGTYIVNSDRIDKNVEERGLFDFQYDPEGNYTRHVVSAALTDSWSNDRIRPEFAVSWGLETEDFYLAPKLEFVLRDDTRLITEAAFFLGGQGYFGEYKDNDFLQVRLEYRF